MAYVFRPAHEKDAQVLYEWFQLPHVYARWPYPQTFAQFKDRLVKKFLTPSARRYVQLYIVEEQGTPLGAIRLFDAARFVGKFKGQDLEDLFGGDLRGIYVRDIVLAEPDSFANGEAQSIIQDFTRDVIAPRSPRGVFGIYPADCTILTEFAESLSARHVTEFVDDHGERMNMWEPPFVF